MVLLDTNDLSYSSFTLAVKVAVQGPENPSLLKRHCKTGHCTVIFLHVLKGGYENSEWLAIHNPHVIFIISFLQPLGYWV